MRVTVDRPRVRACVRACVHGKRSGANQTEAKRSESTGWLAEWVVGFLGGSMADVGMAG